MCGIRNATNPCRVCRCDLSSKNRKARLRVMLDRGSLHFLKLILLHRMKRIGRGGELTSEIRGFAKKV